MKALLRFVHLSDTPRRFAPPLFIEGNQTHAAEVPSMKRGARQGGVCRIICGLFGLGLLLTAHAAPSPFDFDLLQARAKTVAARPYAVTPTRAPGWLQAYNYSQYSDIRFNTDHAWWKAGKLPFQLQFYHPGWLFKQPVQMHEVLGANEQLIPFSTGLFNYLDGLAAGRLPPDLGFAGFRIHYALNKPEYLDELVSFLGASYFRSLGRGMHYGLSARGLAVNTGEPGDEEFPRFEEFWVERPAADAKVITVFALLNSPSVTGAYRFVITPGIETVMDVKVVVYLRRSPAVVGLAPLTSMFQHGENTGWSRDDYRPEVHDSDGLLMQNGAGEWIWRDLTNPVRTRTSTFQDKAPRGFGLLQRDRDFIHYDDIVANYHLRPSAWVEPVGDWGAGTIRLLEIPTRDETNDNIVACWVPAKLPALGEPLAYEYRLHWFMDATARPPAGHVASTRQGAVLDHPERRRFVVDFAGENLDQYGANLEAVVTVGAGAKLDNGVFVQKIAPLGVWRTAFVLVPDGSGRPVELRCFLRKDNTVLTETWSHLWNP